jgi:hypothetical protein
MRGRIERRNGKKKPDASQPPLGSWGFVAAAARAKTQK